MNNSIVHLFDAADLFSQSRLVVDDGGLCIEGNDFLVRTPSPEVPLRDGYQLSGARNDAGIDDST